MTEVKLPQTEAELRALLEGAIEYGRQEGPRKTAAAPTEQPQAAPRVSKEQLQEQFRADISNLSADPRNSPSKLRGLQAKYQEMGLTWEDVDVTPRGGIQKGQTIHDWTPPGYQGELK